MIDLFAGIMTMLGGHASATNLFGGFKETFHPI